MSATRKATFELTPEQAYALVLAALDMVGTVTPSTHKRIRTPGNNSNPIVGAEELAHLVDVLNELRPGLADRVIDSTHAQRRTIQRARQVEIAEWTRNERSMETETP